MKKSLPRRVSNFVNSYFNLPLGGKKVACPYFINIRKMRQRMGLRVLIGKGTPEEIIQETLIYEKLRGANFFDMTEDEIRDFMVKRHIGIDCSGFIVHVLNRWLKTLNKKRLWKYIKFPKQSLYRRIARLLRPVENISVTTLTNSENTKHIRNLNNLRCGDLIRLKGLKGGHHVMMISKLIKEKGIVKSFKYIHATRWYKDKHGVREGEVIVKDVNSPLYKQKWMDSLNGKNWTYEEVLKDKNYSQIRRIEKLPIYSGKI